MGKHRYWEAFLSVSASGPEFSPSLEQNGIYRRPRMTADLNYTTADVDFLYDHFVEPEDDRPRQKDIHIRLPNPSRSDFFDALEEVQSWLLSCSKSSEWDGGGIHFNFAGHGTENSGAIVLEDGEVTPDEYLETVCKIATDVSSPNRLRLCAVLDSCHSGAWVTSILDSCFNKNDNLIIPLNVYAACMEDELAWEDSSLGHGLFTYCFSVRPPVLGAIGAEAIQPDNSFGSSISIIGGERGCSLLTAGKQNPVAYWNGAGEIEVCQNGFSIFDNSFENCLSLDEMREKLHKTRDEILRLVKPAFEFYNSMPLTQYDNE